MDPVNLSTVMATNLIWAENEKDIPAQDMLEQIQQSQNATTFLIENYHYFFKKLVENPFEIEPLSIEQDVRKQLF